MQDLENMYDQFLQEAVRLQSKYEDQICLLIGLETEYFNRDSIGLVRTLRQPRQQYQLRSSQDDSTTAGATAVELPQVQYIVGSLHHVHGVPLDFSQELYLKALETVGKGSWETLFREYFDAQYEMLQGLEPEVVGHLDLVRIFFGAIKGCHHGHGHDHGHEDGQEESGQGLNQNRLTEELWTLVKRNVDFVIGYGGLFELNSRAWKKGLADAYPQRDILEVSFLFSCYSVSPTIWSIKLEYKKQKRKEAGSKAITPNSLLYVIVHLVQERKGNPLRRLSWPRRRGHVLQSRIEAVPGPNEGPTSLLPGTQSNKEARRSGLRDECFYRDGILPTRPCSCCSYGFFGLLLFQMIDNPTPLLPWVP